MASTKSQLKEINRRVAAMGRQWQELLRPAIDRIERNLKAGMAPQKAVAEAWQATGASKIITDGLRADVLNAAYDGAGGYDAVLSRPAFEQAILGSKWAGDMTTIIRLTRAPRKMQAAVADTVRSAVIRGDSVRNLAIKLADGFFSRPMVPTTGSFGDALPKKLLELTDRAVSGGLEPKLVGELRKFRDDYIDQIGGRFPDTSKLGAAYRDLVTKLESGTEKQIARSIEAAVNQKARYIGERIARTEMARANWEGFAANKFADPQVTAVRFRLSSDHPKEDICDFITSLDSGLGAGVYPKNDLPSYPFHPNCICWYEEIYAVELKGKTFEGPEKGAVKLLNSAPTNSRAAMMGANYRAKEFKADPQKALQLVAGWGGLSKLKPVILPDMLK